MRGAPKVVPCILTGRRIIPADAGSTDDPGRRRHPSMDHPRGCGEHLSSSRSYLLKGGSSPRMRGAPTHKGRQRAKARIIPADAGSTYTNTEGRDMLKDHPRGCGEHWQTGCSQASSPGSSPRMRGALMIPPRYALFVRIIPADAGSTSRTAWSRAVRRDHPRGCGEHIGARQPH